VVRFYEVNVKEQVVIQKEKAVIQKEKAVMPGHDPASMNPGPWIAGQARNDSQGSAMTDSSAMTARGPQ